MEKKRRSRKLRPGIFWYLLIYIMIFGSVIAAEFNTPDKGFGTLPTPRKIKVGGDFDYWPYTFLDESGRPRGHDVDLIRQIARRANLELEFEFTPWAEALSNLEQGKTDVVLGILFTDQRSLIYDFTIPHDIEFYSIFVRRNSDISNLEDLQGKESIALKGDASIENFLKPQGLFNEAVYADSLPDALQMLIEGHHDFVVAPHTLGMHVLENTAGGEENIKVIGPPILPSLYRFAVKKGNSDLLRVLNEGIDYLKTNGELAAINSKWKSDRKELWAYDKMLRYLLFILVPLGLIALLLILWSWSLKREVRRKTKNLKLAVVNAEKANTAKTRFINTISHEIRTPLNAILGFSQVLKLESRKHPLPQEFIQYLEKIEKSGKKLSTLFSNFVEISKIDSREIRIFPESVRIKEFIEDVYQELKAKSLEKKVFLDYTIDSQLGREIETDPVKLRQVIGNLLESTLNFSPAGSSIQLRVRKQRDWLAFEVEGEGTALPESYRNVLLNPSRIQEADRDIEYDTTGLSLTLTREFVGVMEGRVEQQETGAGRRIFRILLPLDSKSEPPVKDDHAPTEKEDHLLLPTFSPDNRVIVVEDDPIAQDFAITLFSKMNLEVKVFGKGCDALDAMEQSKADLVLMDLRLPDISGLDAVSRARSARAGKSVPIYLFTADRSILGENQELPEQVDGFLEKPLELEQLIPILKKHLK